MAVLSEPQFLPVSTASSGNTTLVAGVAGQKVRVLAMVIVAASAVAAKFVSGASPDLTGAMSLTTGRAVMIGKPPFGIIETAVGAALTLNLSGAVQTSGFVVYALVT